MISAVRHLSQWLYANGIAPTDVELVIKCKSRKAAERIEKTLQDDMKRSGHYEMPVKFGPPQSSITGKIAGVEFEIKGPAPLWHS